MEQSPAGTAMELALQMITNLLIGMHQELEKKPDMTGKDLLKAVEKAEQIIKLFAGIVEE